MSIRTISVVGGGVAGLMAAYTLGKDPGVRVQIFEGELIIGGRTKSKMIRGKNVDFGGFLIYSWYEEAHRLFQEIDCEKELVKLPVGDIFYVLGNDGVALKEDDIPFSKLEGLRIWMKSLFKVLPTDALAEPDLMRFEGKTIAEYLRSTLNAPDHVGLHELFFDTVSQGYCYGPVVQTKAAFMLPIARQISLHGDIRSTSFFPNGIQALTDCLVKAIVDQGGALHVGTPITSVEGHVLRSGEAEFESDAIVFAQTVSKDLYESIMPEVKIDCWYTHFLTVAIELPETPMVAGARDWGAVFYASNEKNRSQILSAINLSALYGSELDGCVMMNIILRNETKDAFAIDEVKAIVDQEFSTIFPGVGDARVLDFVHWKKTMPVSQEAFVQAVRERQGKNGYYFAGDFLGSPSIETAIATGKMAAERVLSSLSIDPLTSECPVCSGKEIATGNVERRDDGKTWHEMKCLECGSVGFEWSKAW